ncbi:MAG: DNA-directed RNA polymerase subunit D [Candidatus Verstraetearchaeota archaeon]|nr:DNA-directed RNA polymerase subunit D [Candidatus Verstraetearchaeota archaeon]RLE56896.1 MAG: DNA-directed RNA polymerase subunit D [Candidatus Verstraetearchaeota archaeon]
MEVEIVESSDISVRFMLRDVDVAFANALRRIMISEVPIMAINEVVILNNTSPIYDEVLAHRLSLIPLKTDLDRFNLPEKCSCGGVGCPKCQVTFVLDVKAENTSKTVYSGDLSSSDPYVTPISDRFPIAKLASGQAILLEAYARLGRGRDGAKWQPVSACAYKYLPVLTVNSEACAHCGECVEACPRGAIALDDDSSLPYLKDIVKCNLCKACVEACELGALGLQADERSFIFYVESTGSLPAYRIVEKAAEILAEKCDGLIEELRGVLK